MTGFEPEISGVGNNCSIICATTTTLFLLTLWICDLTLTINWEKFYNLSLIC